MIRPRWLLPSPPDPTQPRLHADPLLHALLNRRGIANQAQAADFLSPKARPAPEPAILPNIELAVGRIAEAIDRGERIGIFGDYDADGITSTALLVRGLRSAVRSPDLVSYTLPSRDEGYGLNRGAIDTFADGGVTLLISVDCGSGDHEHVAYARSIGLDVIALDHHQIPAGPAEGAIVVSAQLPGGEAARDLSAVGVAYLVICALAREGYSVGGPNGQPETALLDLVAIGTVADMVPLSGINRGLVRDGLAQIQRSPSPGILELCRTAGVPATSIGTDHIGFKLAPRLNAAGRMGDPGAALALMLADDAFKAARLSTELESINERRRAESTRVLREAETMISAKPEVLQRKVLLLWGRNWPSGVLGPVATNLVERYGRPVAVLAEENGVAHGSARSVAGFDMTAALKRAETLLVRFGGHEQAAGLTIERGNIAALADSLEEDLAASGIEVPAPPVIQLDAELPLNRLTIATVDALKVLEPFGMGNEQPLFLISGIDVRQWDAVGADKSHLRLQCAIPGGTIKGIGFGLAARSRELVASRRIDLAATIKIDSWNGQRRLDVEIKDFRPAV